MKETPAGLHEISSPFGCSHVLVENGRAVVIDTGLLGGGRRFARTLQRLGLTPDVIDAIILTHGHLDHAGNAALFRDWTHAPILAHPAEQAHINGNYPYSGSARFCGALEALGRKLARYRPVRIDRPLHDNELLPWWGGLRVIHLPGHTVGHCGLWSEKHRLLFCGDLVAIWAWRTTFPPFYFNTEGEKLRPSLQRAQALQPRLVVPNHYSHHLMTFDPANLAARFHQFARRTLGTHP